MAALVVNQVWGKVPYPLKDRADTTELLDRLPEPATSEGKQGRGGIELGGGRVNCTVGQNQQTVRVLVRSAGQSVTRVGRKGMAAPRTPNMVISGQPTSKLTKISTTTILSVIFSRWLATSTWPSTLVNPCKIRTQATMRKAGKAWENAGFL